MKLNFNQIQASESIDQHVCILASAGCGKTTVLVAHYLELLRKKNLRPSQIVVTTFSEKSAADIKQKILHLFRESEDLAHLLPEFLQAPISTLHGLAGRILRDSSFLLGLDPHFRVLDENQAASLQNEALKEVLQEQLHQSSPFLSLLIQTYPWRGLEREFYDLLQAWPEWKERFSQDFEKGSDETETKLKEAFAQVFLKILEKYEAKKKEKELLDFNDLEEKAIELLQKNIWVAKHYQKQWKAYLIDEFQDTSHRQDLLLSLLLPQNSEGKLSLQTHLAIVGDPKQSIYGFRGAKAHIFEKYQALIENSGGMTVELNENYRSPSTLLDFINALFTPIFSNYSSLIGNRELPQSLEILKSNEIIEEMKSDERRKQEAQSLSLHLQQILKEGVKSKEIFVLVRSSRSMAPYLKAFRNAGLPVFVKSGESLLTRQEIQDLLHALRVFLYPNQALSWIGLLRSPAFHLSDEQLLEYSLDHGLKPDWTQIHPLAQKLLQQDKNQSPSQFIEWWLNETALISLYSAEPSLQPQAQNLLQFYNFCFEWEQTHPAKLEEFLKEMEVLIEENIPFNSLSDQLGGNQAITFMTIHQSKGLDLPVVVLPDLKVNSSQAETRSLICAWEKKWGLKVPDSKPGLKKNLKSSNAFQENLKNLQAAQAEEENRIFYVATTRSTQKLILGFLPSENQKLGGKPPSLILSDPSTRSARSGSSFSILSRPQGTEFQESKDEKKESKQARDFLQTVGKNFSAVRWISPLQEISEPNENKILNKIQTLSAFKHKQILHFGVSALETFQRSPQEYRERYIDQIPAESLSGANRFRPSSSLSGLKKGQILHEALYLYFKEKTSSPAEILTSCLAKHAIDSQNLPELLEIFSRTLKHSNFSPILNAQEAYFEIDFRLLLDFYEIQGAIDCLYLHEKTWKVLDYKTHALEENRSKKELPAKPFEFQLKTYCLAASKMLGQTTERAEVYFIIPNKTFSFNFKEEELKKHELYLKNLMNEINQFTLTSS